MNKTFAEIIIELLAGEAVRRNEWEPQHFIRLLFMPTTVNRPPKVVEYNNKSINEYAFTSEDIAHDKWKVLP